MKKFYFLLLALGFFTSVNAQIITIPDVNFKAKLVAASPSNFIAKDFAGNYFKIDANSDGEIQESEALQVGQLYLHGSGISSLIGIEYFTNLTFLSCGNNTLTSLNVNSNTSLVHLDCSINQITNLNISGISSLKSIFCNSNAITSLNISNCNNLTDINCNENDLTTLDVSGLNALDGLLCGQNNLTTLHLNPALVQLYCSYNNLSNIDFSGLNALNSLDCSFNLFETIDISNLPGLNQFYCSHNNLLKAILMKYNGLDAMDFVLATSVSSCPLLKYICVEDARRSIVFSHLLAQSGITGVEVNSYCSFVPGGTIYTVEGNIKFDKDSDGCGASDLGFPYLKFDITNGINTETFVPDASGNYSFLFQAGTHTITPKFENPDYFSITPSSVNVSFPAQTSPVAQNFCIKPNGPIQDLEVLLLPLSRCRPGFDTTFKIIYKNKGTVTQSGSVVIDYFDHVADFVSSVPALSSESGNLLTWNYTDLKPFETREITFTVNINSQMEIPAVNNGDIISFEAYVYPVIDDLTSIDNHIGLREVVVGSFDPNDKTCLEGSKITPDKVGEYVHYMIRFENTGTANAENIVVKDMIDTAKFDIASLVPMKGSHSFVTNITSGNRVEFIFENINLPFDNANNDGYVAFKIKTLPTLVNGDTFSNTASIYFDYNFPIVTNTATTTVASLGVKDFEFSNYFRLYPNPVHDVLNITAKESIAISSINVYNTLGQLVLVIPNAKDIKKVDVSSLTSGNYFIKVLSDKGTSNAKFIKN